MPTTPPPGWYEPEISIEKIRPLIDQVAPVLEEVVRYGLALLARASVTARGADEHAAFFSLYHHLLGMVDESSALLRQCAGSGIVLTLRSAFESLVSLEYMDGDFHRRAYAWLVADAHRRWQFYKTLDLRLEQGKQLEQLRQADSHGKEVTIRPPESSLDEQYARFQRLLASRAWVEANAEWTRVRGVGKAKRRPEWYQLYGGPGSVQGMAERVNRGYQYHLLYRQWSVTMHAAGLLDHFRKTTKGDTDIAPLRNGNELAGQAQLALNFGLDGIRLALRRYRSEEEPQFAKWYIAEIRPTNMLLSMPAPTPPRSP